MKSKFLEDVEQMMRATRDGIAEMTGEVPGDDDTMRVAATDDRKNEAVIFCWSAVSAEDEVESDDDLSSGLLVSGTTSLAVTGALILGMCDRLIRAGIHTGAFPDAEAPLLSLAKALLEDSHAGGRCGHA